MDTTVSGIGAVVVAELRASGYMESTVGQYAKTIKALTEFASGREYSTGLGAEFASMTTSVRTGRFSRQRRFDYRRLVAVFDSYVQTGRVNLAVRGRGGGGPRPEGSDFVALYAGWEAEMGCRGLAPATREAYGRVARSYLVFLEGRGIAVLDGADGGSCPGVFGIPTGSVGQVVAVLGGVELSSVPEVHRPHRSGQCAESGWHQTFSRDSPRLGGCRRGTGCSRLCVGGGQRSRRCDHVARIIDGIEGLRHRGAADG